MKRFIILIFQTAVIFSLGIYAPTMAAKTDQTHLSKLVKTKQLLLVKTTRRIGEILPVKMARISAYEATLADYMGRAHQLRFLGEFTSSSRTDVPHRRGDEPLK